MYSFDFLITPKIIALLYWISNIGCLFYFFDPLAENMGFSFERLIGTIIGWVIIRVSFELVMVSFKNNEYLRKIAARED